MGASTLHRRPENAAAIVREMNRQARREKGDVSNVDRATKLQRRFGADDRLFTEKNLHWKQLANVISYLAQFVSLAGAAYMVFKFIYEPTVGGYISLFLFAGILIGFELLQRWTSDEFWDRFALGSFSMKYAFLNFGVIWTLSVAITLAGFYFGSRDTTSDPQMFDDPVVAGIRADIAALEAKNDDYKTNDQYKVSAGRDQGEIRWKFQETIAANEAQIATLTQSLNDRFGVTASIDLESIEYHKLTSQTRTWFFLILALAVLIIFEVCMWYRSYYDRIALLELQLSGDLPGK